MWFVVPFCPDFLSRNAADPYNDSHPGFHVLSRYLFLYFFLVPHRVAIYGFLDPLNLEYSVRKGDRQDPNRCVGFGLSFPNRRLLGLGIKQDVCTSPPGPCPVLRPRSFGVA